MLLMNGVRTDLLDTSTLTSQSSLAKFSGFPQPAHRRSLSGVDFGEAWNIATCR